MCSRPVKLGTSSSENTVWIFSIIKQMKKAWALRITLNFIWTYLNKSLSNSVQRKKVLICIQTSLHFNRRSWCVYSTINIKNQRPTSSTSAHKSQIVEPCYLVFHNSRGISELSRIIFIVTRHDSNHSPIWYLSEGYHLHKTGNTAAIRAHQKSLDTENIFPLQMMCLIRI